ncbi:hypothetical protein ADL15_00135 [Actinoplanes awajinensis subsp. mycoplanecinus]|uniref:Uncharacterized protein n=1 Tax=Actinoplanes awajinensis subsp. mycoplanecinus TaxID=135947 RepID=A0A0X3VD40_9ACTN|nr:hypothetical protein ADL15_00135 [Actinoplanes awajinensis subsp. mycoplanecinus]
MRTWHRHLPDRDLRGHRRFRLVRIDLSHRGGTGLCGPGRGHLGPRGPHRGRLGPGLLHLFRGGAGPFPHRRTPDNPAVLDRPVLFG